MPRVHVFEVHIRLFAGPFDIAVLEAYKFEVVYRLRGRTGFDGDEEARDAYRGP
jgi:hypothetical protein